jgi:ferritin-like metal-binding protein YciE
LPLWLSAQRVSIVRSPLRALATWTKQLGFDEQCTLHTTLEEKNRTGRILTGLAKRLVTADAAPA